MNKERVMNKKESEKVLTFNINHITTAGGSLATAGGSLAMAISWSLNNSILWAILHGFCSWFYVIYYALVR